MANVSELRRRELSNGLRCMPEAYLRTCQQPAVIAAAFCFCVLVIAAAFFVGFWLSPQHLRPLLPNAVMLRVPDSKSAHGVIQTFGSCALLREKNVISGFAFGLQTF